MSEVVTLELPDYLIRSARTVAAQTSRRLEDVLVEWLDRAAAEAPVDQLPDDKVLALRDGQMSASDQAELHQLLVEQREGEISTEGRHRLNTLLHLYRTGMIRKAQALKVAVERGLQPPLSE